MTRTIAAILTVLATAGVALGQCPDCGPRTFAWQIYEPAIGEELSEQYLDSLEFTWGEWCIEGDLTNWECTGVRIGGGCFFGKWIAVGRSEIPDDNRWLVVNGSREEKNRSLCFVCLEEEEGEKCSPIPFRDDFEDGLKRWSRVEGGRE